MEFRCHFDRRSVRRPRLFGKHTLRALNLLLLGSFALTTSSQSANTRLYPLRPSDLCVTEGALEERPDHRLSVRVPAMRAYVNHATSQDVEARFTYLGPTEEQVRLRGGELRVQFGLKLLAEDGCNLVYAMWRFAPSAKLVVSLKSNPGQHTSSACTNRGYQTIRPTHSSPVPSISGGQTHSLRAVLQTEDLRVFADGRMVWQGTLGAAGLQGPVGIRTDNVRADFELLAGAQGAPQGAEPSSCKNGGKESE